MLSPKGREKNSKAKNNDSALQMTLLREQEDKLQARRKILAKHMSGKRFVSKIFKELVKWNNKKANIPT